MWWKSVTDRFYMSFSWLTVSVLLLSSWFRWVCIYRSKQQRHMNEFTLICLCSQTHCPGWLPPAARCSCWGSPRGRRAPLECRAAAGTAGWWCSQRAALQGGGTCEPQHKHQTRGDIVKPSDLYLWIVDTVSSQLEISELLFHLILNNTRWCL